MKVEYVKDNKKRLSDNYIAIRSDSCCQEFDETTGIVFRDDPVTKIPMPYLSHETPMFDHNRLHNYSKEELFQIKFCPFCGEEIEVVVYDDEQLDTHFLKILKNVREYNYKLQFEIMSREQRSEMYKELMGFEQEMFDLVKQNKYLKEVNISE